MYTRLKSNTKEVTIGDDKPFVIIGEKINPTGIKKLGQALVEQNFDYVKTLAQRQVAWGAEVLDVNVGHPQIDEAAIMPKVVEAILSVVDLPLCIDSNEPKILEAGLKVITGKPLVNSVNGEEKQLATVLPIVRDRGAAVIGLTALPGSARHDATVKSASAMKGFRRVMGATSGVLPGDYPRRPVSASRSDQHFEPSCCFHFAYTPPSMRRNGA